MLNLTKNSIIQQFNTLSGQVVSAYGTIVGCPNEYDLLNLEWVTSIRLVRYTVPFNNTDLFKTDVGDVNQIAGTYFNVEEEIPWAAGAAV